jgi:RES domain-containing protein
LSIAEYVRPWSGYAFRHIPDRASLDVRDFRYCADSKTNRWNFKGEPTLYLAKDKSVVIGEFSRHFSEDRSPKLLARLHRRQIWKLSVRLSKSIDLCNPITCKALSLDDPPHCFANVQIARSTATFLRNTLKIDGIFVPSMVFLDDLSKWCLVVFLENLPEDSTLFFPQAAENGFLNIQ